MMRIKSRIVRGAFSLAMLVTLSVLPLALPSSNNVFTAKAQTLVDEFSPYPCGEDNFYIDEWDEMWTGDTSCFDVHCVWVWCFDEEWNEYYESEIECKKILYEY
jgi:hypothetical protein